MSGASLFSPAKLNLFLAITGRRADGFHDLVSVAAPLDFGDILHVEEAKGFSLTCDDPDVPVDGSNLVLRAAEAFAAASGWRGGARFRLEKKIPMGAGLGGGSSNAVAALRALNQLAGNLLNDSQLAALAAQLGSDCPLFLAGEPVVMRGRGERIARLPADARARIQGRRVLLFKPAFGVATPWAYGRLAAASPGSYRPSPEAEAQLAGWCAEPGAPLEALLSNSMEPPVFAKFIALPTLLAQLAADFRLQPRMSGSGSACFALLHAEMPTISIIRSIHDAWGPSAFAIEAQLM